MPYPVSHFDQGCGHVRSVRVSRRDNWLDRGRGHLLCLVYQVTRTAPIVLLDVHLFACVVGTVWTYIDLAQLGHVWC